VLVARPLRKFGKYTITDFLSFRYPHPLVRLLVPAVIVVSFTAYIVAQMKAAGITANALLGFPYEFAVILSAVVFILYVSVGGMVAVTWTDVFQGTLMMFVVLGVAFTLAWQGNPPTTAMAEAIRMAPEMGTAANQPITSSLGYFVIWASAISVIPHIVMRVFTAKDAMRARLSLNIAMVVYAVLILTAVFAIVPVGKIQFPDLTDADQVFLKVMDLGFSPFFRGLAVAAVLAAVMSTTGALLLACSSAVSHDLLVNFAGLRLSNKAASLLQVATAWVIGGLALYWALDPPELISEFYTAAVGIISAGLFVPTVAGLWWKRANLAGGISALVTGALLYALIQVGIINIPISPILVALPASGLAMWAGGRLGAPESPDMVEQIARLHEDTD
jgi:sodium/pantothenate symporter